MNDLDVGRDGMVWGCTGANKLVYRTGIAGSNDLSEDDNGWVARNAEIVHGDNWMVEDVAERCVNVAVCTSGHVWAVTPSGGVVFRQGIIASTHDRDLVGAGWSNESPENMQAAEVACGGNRQVWMTGNDGKLYHKTATQDFTRPQGERNPDLFDDGSWSSISVGENGQVFGLNAGKATARVGYDA